jgi:hypothetical protein
LIPSGFTKDTWITSLEIKPSVLPVTHHICFTFQAHKPDAKYYVPNWSESPRDDEVRRSRAPIRLRTIGREPVVAAVGSAGHGCRRRVQLLRAGSSGR